MRLRQRLRGFFQLSATVFLSFGWLACEPTEQDYAAYPSIDASPNPGPAQPPDGPLLEAAQGLEAGKPKAAAKLLSSLQLTNPLEKAWQRLLLGQAWFELGVHDKGLRLLLANYEELRDARPPPDPIMTRILAQSLKILGAYYSDKQDFERAYTFHQLQWMYMRRFGSFQDRWDALLSLDGDAALLRNYFACEQWLREALLVVQQMPDGPDRLRSLIIVWNNLGASFVQQSRFTEAEAAARENRRLSQIYDSSSGRYEFREIAALAQSAEIFGAWALAVASSNAVEAKPLYQKSQAAALEALALSAKQNLPENDSIALDQRMQKHCGPGCRLKSE